MDEISISLATRSRLYSILEYVEHAAEESDQLKEDLELLSRIIESVPKELGYRWKQKSETQLARNHESRYPG